ncbi:F-box protein At1g67130 [Oryza sativa Japonica Group]|uniref:F-box protein At1g67130 n=1 Tax=Oryza sativa subsp. japonica TaxID=39947 RepID=UPI0001C7D293|nr:F-box domain-containing protein [Oryza sativa Japonica Group]
MAREKSKKEEEGSSATRNPAAELTEDLIVDILSRLPVKSVCRCKCVSRRWRGLISDPDHRKKLPQTLAGFFYSSENESSFPDEETFPIVICETLVALGRLSLKQSNNNAFSEGTEEHLAAVRHLLRKEKVVNLSSVRMNISLQLDMVIWLLAELKDVEAGRLCSTSW